MGSGTSIKQSLATFSAVLKSMTMGDESLDEHVAEMIALMEYPKSSFTFKEVKVIDRAVLSFGGMTQVVVNGTLDFKGLKAPVSVTSQIEPVLNDAGEPRLQVYAFFKMPLKEKWDVDGPDGPEASSNFLDFNLNFLLKPDGGGPGTGAVEPLQDRSLERAHLHGDEMGGKVVKTASFGGLAAGGDMGSVPIHTKSIEVNGLKYTYLEAGQGPTVILLHGFPDLASTWKPTMQELAGDYRCIAPYLRGYYPSDTASR